MNYADHDFTGRFERKTARTESNGACCLLCADKKTVNHITKRTGSDGVVPRWLKSRNAAC